MLIYKNRSFFTCCSYVKACLKGCPSYFLGTDQTIGFYHIGQAVGWYHAGEGAGFIASVIVAFLILFIYGKVAKKK